MQGSPNKTLSNILQNAHSKHPVDLPWRWLSSPSYLHFTVLVAPGGPHASPMNLAIREVTADSQAPVALLYIRDLGRYVI